jgi:putative oxidoreductase
MANRPPKVQAAKGSGSMHQLEKLKPLAQLLLRLTLAIIFIYHGYPKLFSERAHWVAAFPGMGFPWYFAYISGALEFFGGCLLVVGLFTRPVALLLAAELFIAVWRVHLAKGVLAVGFYQFPLLLAVASLTLMIIGGGTLSVDRAIFGSKQ